MKLRLGLIVILLVTVAGGGAWNWRQQKELVRQRALAAAARERTTEATLRAVSAVVPAPIVAPPAPDRAPAPTAGGAGDGRAPPPATLVREAGAAPDPEIERERRNYALLDVTTSLDQGYAPLFRMLVQTASTSPAQVEQLKALLLRRHEIVLDAENTGAVVISPTVSAGLAGVDAQIEQALGGAGYAQFLQFQKTLPQRNAVQLVAQAIDHDVAPLTSAQTEQLVDLLVRHPSSLHRDPAELLNEGIFAAPTAQATITDEAMRAAGAILSPGQLRALTQVQQQRQAQAKMFAWLGRLQRPVRPADGAPR